MSKLKLTKKFIFIYLLILLFTSILIGVFWEIFQWFLLILGGIIVFIFFNRKTKTEVLTPEELDRAVAVLQNAVMMCKEQLSWLNIPRNSREIFYWILKEKELKMIKISVPKKSITALSESELEDTKIFLQDRINLSDVPMYLAFVIDCGAVVEIIAIPINQSGAGEYCQKIEQRRFKRRLPKEVDLDDDEF